MGPRPNPPGPGPDKAFGDPNGTGPDPRAQGDGTGTVPNSGGTPWVHAKGQYPFLSAPDRPGVLGRLGPYRVLRLLGQGGMGYVFQAEEDALKRIVALKVIRLELATWAMAKDRFLAEAQAAAAVRSDHVITIYQVGEANGVAYLAMEYLDGMNLDDWLKSWQKTRRPIPVAAIFQVAKGMLRGLMAAHDKKLIHRDIKPSNLWIESGTNRVKLLDFGLTKSLDGDLNLTRTNEIIGTPAYMSPEQARSSKMVDARADLFSAGVVLHRMLGGINPFERDGYNATIIAIATEEAPPAASFGVVPDEMATLIDRMLAKNPDHRPQSAKAALAVVLNAEQQLLAGGMAPLPMGETEPLLAEDLPLATSEASWSTARVLSKEQLDDRSLIKKGKWYLAWYVTIAIGAAATVLFVATADRESTTNTAPSLVIRSATPVPPPEFKERLDAANAHTGDVQISLIWDNHHDLDLHCYDPQTGEDIYFGNKKSRTGGWLDVDSNAGCVRDAKDKAVENIVWEPGRAPDGLYQVFVHFYTPCPKDSRSDPNHKDFETPFRVRILAEGEEKIFPGVVRYTPDGRDRYVRVHEFRIGPKLKIEAPAEATVRIGASLDIPFRLIRINTSGPATVTANHLPAGVKAAPVSVPAGESTGTIKLTTSGATAGTEGIELSATAENRAGTAPLTLTVIEAAKWSWRLILILALWTALLAARLTVALVAGGDRRRRTGRHK